MSLIRIEHKKFYYTFSKYKKTQEKIYFAEGQGIKTTVSAKKYTEEIAVFKSPKMLTFRKNSGR